MTMTITRKISNRIFKRKQNALIVIYGEPGSGKSWLALRLGEIFEGKRFIKHLKKRIIFKPLQFVDLMKTRPPRGSVVIFDEAGCGMYNREWYSQSNKEIIKILQTFRTMGLIVIFTVPHLDYIDTQARKIFQYTIETQKVDHENKRTYAKIKRYKYDSMLEKSYNPYLRRGGNKYKISKFKPPHNIVTEQYEEMANTYKMKIIEEAQNTLHTMERKEEKKQSKKLNLEKVVEDILNNRDTFIRDNGRPYKQLIDAKYKPTRSQLEQIVGMVKLKLEESLNENGIISNINITGSDKSKLMVA